MLKENDKTSVHINLYNFLFLYIIYTLYCELALCIGFMDTITSIYEGHMHRIFMWWKLWRTLMSIIWCYHFLLSLIHFEIPVIKEYRVPGECGLRGLSGSSPVSGWGCVSDRQVSWAHVSQYWCWQVGGWIQVPEFKRLREESTVALTSTGIHVVDPTFPVAVARGFVPRASPRCLLLL